MRAKAIQSDIRGEELKIAQMRRALRSRGFHSDTKTRKAVIETFKQIFKK